ncbi:MAG: MarR family transcriptional regulator [Ekhidna sp.]
MTENDKEIGQTRDFTSRFSEAFVNLMIKMEEVDDWCVQATKDITKQELLLIGFIGEHVNVIMRDVAEFLDVPFSTATGIVDKLVSKDYLKRFNSEDDRRVVMVCLAKEKGQSTHKMMIRKKKEMSEQVQQTLNETEREHLVTLLEKITKGLTDTL